MEFLFTSMKNRNYFFSAKKRKHRNPALLVFINYKTASKAMESSLGQSIIYKVRPILPMAEIDITRMSSKGQVVIPAELRHGIKEGEKLVVIRSRDQLILQKADKFDKNLAGDLEFARRTEKAWKDYQKGKFVSKSKEEFLAELEKW